MRESEAKFRAITNSIDQMIWSTLPDGFLDYYNDRWYEYTGVPPGSTDGEAWNGMFHPDDQPRAWAVRDDEVRKRSAELQQAEERLRHAQKMEAIGQLTGGIAHDFNNMLQGITVALDLSSRLPASGRADEIPRFLQMAMGSTQRAASMTHRLLAFSRRQPLAPQVGGHQCAGALAARAVPAHRRRGSGLRRVQELVQSRAAGARGLSQA